MKIHRPGKLPEYNPEFIGECLYCTCVFSCKLVEDDGHRSPIQHVETNAGYKAICTCPTPGCCFVVEMKVKREP
jgi:hypothetical protein